MGHRPLQLALRQLLALAVVVPIALVARVAPAHAEPPAHETGLKQIIQQTAGWAEAGLSRVGQLAQPLPLLDVSPGTLVDADKLVKTASDALAAHGLTNENRDLGNGARLFSGVSEEPDGGHLLDLVLVVKREVTAKDFTAAGITAAGAVDITGWATLRLKAKYLAGEAFLVRDSDAPRLDIDAVAKFRADLSGAGASVGILEVALLPGETTLTATTHLVAKVSDPDGDGRLSFQKELAAEGSLAGLVQIGLDSSGGGKISDTEDESGPGSINAVMNLGGQALDLPALNATITVAWPSIGTGQPVMETEGLDGTIGKFRNMTPLDLASGLAQLATLLAGVQQSQGAGNLDLPFLRGTFADAVKINEKLVAFLKKNVHPKPEDPEFQPGVDDPALAGEPKFTSIQQLLSLLQDEGLLAGTPLAFADEKLSFSISLARSDDTEGPLDPGAATVSGKGATFTPSGFTLPDNRLQAGALKGQRVVAGTSAGTVADNTADSVTLTGKWIGGRPADDSTWVISSSDPHTGAVQLGGLFTETLDDDKKIGLRTANAQLSLAKVKPRYSAGVTIVLDLRDDLGSLAANADRVLLRTTADAPLFAAAFPISSAIDFYAKVGFLKVRINGSLAVGPTVAGGDMLQVRFRDSGDISLGTLFERLKDDPAGLFAVTTDVRTTGQAKLSVPGDTGILGEGVGATFSWVAGEEPQINLTNLDGLFKLDFNPDDPNALFGYLVEALKLVNNSLAAGNNGSGLMDQKIPLVGKSARELLGSDESGVGSDVTYTADSSNFLLKDASRDSGSAFSGKLKDRTIVVGTKAYRIQDVVDGQTLRILAAGSATPENGAAYAVRPELAEAVDRLLANPPETLQDALDMMNQAIGEGSGLSFALDQREGGPYLRVGLDWKRKFHTAAPLAFSWSGVGDLVTLDSSGAASLDITGDAQLGLLLPLRLTDVMPLLDHASSASITVAAAASNVALAARAGPISLELGKEGDFAGVQANLKFGLGSSSEEDKPVLQGLLGLTPQLTTEGTDCGDGVGGADVPLCARAPVFLNDCDPPAGTNVLSFQINMDYQISHTLPDLGPCLEDLILKLTDFNVGIDGYLAKLETALRLASFDGKLPLVGDDLQQGERFIHQLREDLKSKLGEALATAPANSEGLQTVLTAKLAEVAPDVTATVACREGVTVPCALSELQSVRIQLTKQQGAPSKADGCSGDDCLSLDVPLNLGIPGLSLKAKQGATNGVQVKLGWKLHLDMVLDRTEGFYIATHSGSDLSPELQIGASFDTNDLEAQLAFIQVTAQKRNTAPLAKAYFAIDLLGSAAEESCFEPAPCTADDNAKLTLGEFGDLGSLFKTQLNADINIDWDLAARIDPSNEVGSALPGISARFMLTWGISNHTGQLQAGDLDITFDEIALDAGRFFTKILKPILDKLKSVTGPLQPVIDTLYAPIPVLSDLSKAAGGPDITLIWLAKTFSTLNGGPKLDFVDTIRAVVDFVKRVPNCTTTCKIPLGSFNINPERALDTLSSPQAAESLITNPQAPTGDTVKQAIDNASDGEKLFTPDSQGKTNAGKTGFTFPIFDNPKSLFGLLLGQDVELIGFDSGPLTLGFSWRQSFGPVYAPPPVMITLSGSASVSARFLMGLDTKGIRHAIEAATDGTSLNAVSLLDGLYFKTHDSDGNAVPVVTLTGEIAAGAEVSVVILKVGIEGGIRLTVGFSWNDPNNDGKFRTSEFLQALLINPICLFTTSGQLTVFLRVYITIDLFLYKKKWSFTLVNAVLLDFKAQPDCSPPPPELGGVSGDTLVVFAGKFGTEAQRGHAVWDNTKDTYNGDVFKIYAIHFADDSDDFDGFVVEALGRRQEFLDKSLTRVVVDGRGYSSGPDKIAMSVLFMGDGDPSGDPAKAKSFNKTAVVIGSDGPDNIRTGTGPSYVDGGLGDDTIVTTDASGVTAWVTGGGGDDNITTGDGNGIVAGDSTLGTATHNVTAGGKTINGIIDWNALTQPASDVDGGTGADTITVGFGSNTVYGNGGGDVLGVMTNQTKANGINTMVGGAGGDTINGGNGNDKLYAYSQSVPASVDDEGSGDAGLVNNIDTAGGEDEVFGSAGVELVTSHSANGQTGKIYGYGGNDVLLGGFGTDQIFGGPGDDYVIAEPSEVGAQDGTDAYGPFRPVKHIPLPAGVQSQTKLLVGGLGRDHIIGGDGGAIIFGDKYLPDETCADNDTFAQPTPSDQGAADLILGGAGAEVVSAGSGNDRAELGGGADRACGQIGNDVLHLGDGDDKGWGGAGADQIHGDGGADFLYGNEDNDGLYGGDGNDTLEGNNGSDNIFGGDHDDRIYGGSRAAAALDGSDNLYGENGVDRIVGDNGDDTPYPYDLSGELTDAGAGDFISGGMDGDLTYGGLGNDVMQGNEGDDYLEGNNGSDTVNGNSGKDQIIGGSSVEVPDGGDFLYGDSGEDLIAGDNARFLDGTPTRLVQGRDVPQREVVLLHNAGGADLIDGGSSGDVLFGQLGTDRVLGGSGDDYAEGGQGIDWVEGNLGNDDLVGGSHTGTPDDADAIFGGAGSDVMLGDNGAILRLLDGDQPTSVTVRVGSTPRIVSLLDTDTFGDDRISGENGVDLAWGQDGNDHISGGGDGDYAEGNGGSDTIHGDAAIEPMAPQPWPGAPTAPEASTPDGQDDLIGGSTRQGFRDGADVIRGNGHDDVILGDNGSLLRTIVNGTEKVYTERYPAGADLTDATVVRTHDPALPGGSTRFCDASLITCEPGGAFGGDELHGDGGNDGIWGQDGDDVIHGGDGDDDLFGELGADTIFGGAGEDAILGDRGGVMNEHLNADDVAALGFTVTLSSVPQESYTGFRLGSYDRRVDLLADTDGDVWVGNLPHNGLDRGGSDLIRGGPGNDNIHGGWGNDIVNGDSGGDQIFGSHGSDVLWGGKGCDPVLDVATPDCLTSGVFNPDSRGDNDRFVDHIFGGSGESVDEAYGSDLLDMKPRGTYPDCAPGRWPVTSGGVTRDPCIWFEMTDMTNASTADNQHHQGTDWIYGGWDRDVMQADVAQNGPNAGDRLMDWNGAYNLYTHCNAAYGGYNDIRQHSPAMQQFLTKLAWGSGAGRSVTDITTPGTSAFRELAYTYQEDVPEHGAGRAYPGTPGHFDDPDSCTD